MRPFHTILAVLSFTAIAAPVQAEEQSSSPASAPTAGEKKICRSQSITGSRLRQSRICKTAAEWRESDEEARQTGRNFQRGGMLKPDKL